MTLYTESGLTVCCASSIAEPTEDTVNRIPPALLQDRVGMTRPVGQARSEGAISWQQTTRVAQEGVDSLVVRTTGITEWRRP